MTASKRILGVILAVALLPAGMASAEPRPTASGQKVTQMRGVTTAQRRAAAARTVDRKLAAGQKNQAVQHPRPHPRKAR